MKWASVRLGLVNGRHYPSLLVNYERDEDELGYEGTVTLWKDGNTRLCKHRVSIRQGSPLGKILITLDAFEHGAWAMTDFEGVGITERDLQWAAAWAAMAIQNRHGIAPCVEQGEVTL